MRACLVCALLVLVASVASASTYTVSKNADSGLHSLRWAIQQANAHPGPDLIRTAIPTLLSHVIRPQSALPEITDDATTIDGDEDDDGDPDVFIDGQHAGAVSGLVITGAKCTVRGLALGGFSQWLIVLRAATGSRVVGCWLGARPNGKPASTGPGAIWIAAGAENVIGGTTAADRNVIQPGSTSYLAGILIQSSSRNVVTGNYIGVAPNGEETYATRGNGVMVYGYGTPADRNRIGGSTAGSGNVFGGLNTGVFVGAASGTSIQGNLFGLGADGDTVLPLSSHGVYVCDGASGTRIGATAAGARNVFAGGATAGVTIEGLVGVAPVNTVIQGNYFGTNQAGTQMRSLRWGVGLDGGGAQTIGGTTKAAGNYFTPTGTADGDPIGVFISAAGPITVRNNSFGRLPAAGDTTGMWGGVRVYSGGTARVLDNTFAGSFDGLYASDPANEPQGTVVWAFGNLFWNCTRAVALWGATTGHLGDLGNASSSDDGGNTFKPSNDWFIYNPAAKDLKAEGNDFTTTAISEIEAKIYDKLDCPYSGRVDYLPLADGGTGGRAGLLAVTGAHAVATNSGGAEVLFALSVPADVTATVLNLAGRPIRQLCAARPCEAGTNTLLWDAHTDNGLQAPAGTYLVRVTAHCSDGATSSALTTLRLGG